MKEVLFIKFINLEEAKNCYGEENLIPISQLKQLLFYTKCGCQPKFIWESEKEDGKIVGWFLKSETTYAKKKWDNNRPVKN